MSKLSLGELVRDYSLLLSGMPFSAKLEEAFRLIGEHWDDSEIAQRQTDLLEEAIRPQDADPWETISVSEVHGLTDSGGALLHIHRTTSTCELTSGEWELVELDGRRRALRDAAAAKRVAVLWTDRWSDADRVCLEDSRNRGWSEEEDAAADRANERYYADMEENPGPYQAMYRDAVHRTVARASR